MKRLYIDIRLQSGEMWECELRSGTYGLMKDGTETEIAKSLGGICFNSEHPFNEEHAISLLKSMLREIERRSPGGINGAE